MKKYIISIIILCLMFIIPTYADMSWVRPTGYNDPDSEWTNETAAYDGNTTTNAYCETVDYDWNSYIEFTIGSMSCSQLRFNARYVVNRITKIDLDVYYDNAWHDVYEGVFTHNTDTAKAIGSTQSVTKARVRFYNPADVGYNTRVYEFAFYSEVVDPTVTTQAVDDINKTTATANGNITDIGGENCSRRGFCYKVGTSGDPTTSDSTKYSDGSFGTGAFDESLTGLTAGTGYRVRAYAINSAGTGYGTTVQCKTLVAVNAILFGMNF